MNDLDQKLQKIATTDWEQFMEIIGPEFTTIIKARLLRKNGKTYQQICIQTGLSMMQARNATKSVKKQQDKAA